MAGKWICIVAVVSVLSEAAHAQGKQLLLYCMHDGSMAL